LELGMRVTSELVKTCGQCWNCRNGSPNCCKSLNEVLFPGGFASETIVLHSDSYKFLSILPMSIDDIMGTLVEPTNCALRAVKRSKIQPGQSVLVIGLGSMGIIASQLLENFGAGKIIGMDKNKSRLETVKKSGLIDVINRNDLDWLEQLKNYTGTRGVDVVIEATGFPAAIGDAFLAARVGGLISVLSVYHGKANNLDILPIVRKELTIVGAKGPYPDQKSDDTSVTVGELQKIQEKLRKIIRIYDFKDSFKAFDDAIKGISIKSVISFKNM